MNYGEALMMSQKSIADDIIRKRNRKKPCEICRDTKSYYHENKQTWLCDNCDFKIQMNPITKKKSLSKEKTYIFIKS